MPHSDVDYARWIANVPHSTAPRIAFAVELRRQGREREAAGQLWAATHHKHPDDCRGWGLSGSCPPYARLPSVLAAAVAEDRRLTPDSWEIRFLHACAAVEWGDNGEPVAQFSGPSVAQFT